MQSDCLALSLCIQTGNSGKIRICNVLHIHNLLCADMQALSNSGEQSYMKGMKTLEINPRHPLIQELKRQVKTHFTRLNSRD